VVLKGDVITPLGIILRGKGAKKTMRVRGAKQQKGQKCSTTNQSMSYLQ